MKSDIYLYTGGFHQLWGRGITRLGRGLRDVVGRDINQSAAHFPGYHCDKDSDIQDTDNFRSRPS